MKRPILFLSIMILFGTVGIAQKKSFPIEGSLRAGLLEGEQGSAFQLGLMGGIKVKTWTTSVGTGLDYYRLRSIPLYLNVQKKIFDRAQTPFLYASGGYHFPWLDNDSKLLRGVDKTLGGLYFGGGIGYQLHSMKKSALFFSAGYSYKKYSEEFIMVNPCLIAPCPEDTETYTHGLKRLSITTGLRF